MWEEFKVGVYRRRFGFKIWVYRRILGFEVGIYRKRLGFKVGVYRRRLGFKVGVYIKRSGSTPVATRAFRKYVNEPPGLWGTLLMRKCPQNTGVPRL